MIELHGNSREFSCVDCAKSRSMDWVYLRLRTSRPPTCDACGGLMRPAVVFFGESLPHDALSAAEEETAACDLFLVVGSSLVVKPAASLPCRAKAGGANLVIINVEATRLDPLADLVINQQASEVLSALC